jgi:hypothetical protein
MAFTAEDRAQVDAALKAGLTRVRFPDGREMDWGTPDALMRVRQMMLREADDAAAKAAGRRRGPLRVIVTKDL